MPVQMLPVPDFEQILLAVLFAVVLIVLGFLLGQVKRKD